MRDNVLIDKSIAFAARIIKLHKYLIKTKKETIISKQIVRSGTSIGANINEANYGQSKADFISKLHIALKETADTEYWLKLLIMSEYLTADMGNSLLNDCLEIKRILIASINTASAKAVEVPMVVIGSQAQTNLETNVFLGNPEASSIMDIPKHISEMMAKRTMSVTKQTTAIPTHIPTRTIIKSTGAKVFQIRENQLIILTARRHLKMYMEEKVKA